MNQAHSQSDAPSAASGRPASLPGGSVDGAMPAADVLVIGGGPSGSTAATLLAQRGHAVTLIEAETHPRFRIGESLLPMSMPVLEKLGVLEAVERTSVRKIGADFTPPDGSEHATFRFDRAVGDSPSYAFEVDRAVFDQLLFDNAAAQGVRTLEACRATAITADDTGAHVTVQQTAADGATTEAVIRARFVLDATGRDTLLASRNKTKQRDPEHASASVFAQFDQVPRRDGDDAGNISIYTLPADPEGRWRGGWMWMIPLPESRDPQSGKPTAGRMSVGVVCQPGQFKTRRGTLDDYLDAVIATAPAAKARLQGARRLVPARAAANYSYRCDAVGGPRHLLVGDAAGFVDPMFSSGVFLGMRAATLAADVADAHLQHSLSARQSQRLLRRYGRDIERGNQAFRWMILRFNTPALRWLMSNPRNILGAERGVISVLAGDGIDSAPVRRRLLVFKVLYYLTAFSHKVFGPPTSAAGSAQKSQRRSAAGSALGASAPGASSGSAQAATATTPSDAPSSHRTAA